MLKKRIHLFELEDFDWFPAVLREAGTSYLNKVVQVSGHAASVAEHLASKIGSPKRLKIVDMCSGGSGPIPLVVDELRKRGIDASATLTDFFPNKAAIEKFADHPHIRYHEESIDATALPKEMKGFRTIMNGLHHFRPEMVSKILLDAQQSGQPIAIYEIVGRDPGTILGTAVAVPLTTLALVPFLRPLRPAWLPLTYIVPAIPAFVAWDGFVSCLRVYSVREMREIIDSLPASKTYRWEAGRFRQKLGPGYFRYVIGQPVNSRKS